MPEQGGYHFGSGKRRRAASIPRRSAALWYTGWRPLRLQGHTEGHGALDGSIAVRSHVIPAQCTQEYHYALIVWTVQPPPFGHDPYKPSWTYFPSREDAQAAAPSDGPYSVVDIDPEPIRDVNSADLDTLVLTMRGEAGREETRKYSREHRDDMWGRVPTAHQIRQTRDGSGRFLR